jgi:hypothetical protein
MGYQQATVLLNERASNRKDVLSIERAEIRRPITYDIILLFIYQIFALFARACEVSWQSKQCKP